MVEHAYDVDGVRVQSRVTPAGGGAAQVTNYLVDTAGGLSHVVAETDGSGTMTAYYVRGGDQLLEVIRGADTRYYHEDGLGSVRALTDSNGVVTDDYGYTAFGEALGWAGADLQPYRFAGEEVETDDTYYLRARWLSPRCGAFVSHDPMWSGQSALPASAYDYAGADPVNSSDPTGLFTSSFGSAAHDEICWRYREEHLVQSPFISCGSTLGRILGQNTVDTVAARLKPDVLNYSGFVLGFANGGQNTFAEIKPMTTAEIVAGIGQLGLYAGVLSEFGFQFDEWSPQNPIVDVDGTPTLFMNFSGLILYTDDADIIRQQAKIHSLEDAKQVLRQHGSLYAFTSNFKDFGRVVSQIPALEAAFVAAMVLSSIDSAALGVPL